MAGFVAQLAVFVVGVVVCSPASAGENRFLAGQLLVATPEMKDTHFAETVIYMLRHNENGAMGVVINRPVVKGPISDLLNRLGVDSDGARGEITLYYGGPVDPREGLVLHSKDYVSHGTIVVQNGFAVTSNIEILRAISHGKGPSRSLVVMGYSSWAPGQLEAEIRAKAWFLIPVEEALIFDEDAEAKWDKARARRKIKI